MRSRFLFTALLTSTVLISHAQEKTSKSLTLWYTQPAQKWTDALPVGNGRMGAMVFGGVSDERIQFNEDTLWKGFPHDYDRKGAHDSLAKIRQLLFDGKTKEASDLTRSHFLSDPVRQKPYQPFGDLHLHFANQGSPSDYHRELDLDSATAITTYQIGDDKFERDVFASYPDHAIVVRITCSKPGNVSFTLKMDSPQTNSATKALSHDTLALAGQVETNGLRFESRVRVVADAGTVTTNGNIISVAKADSATLFLVAATSFKNYQDISGDPASECAKDLEAVSHKSYESVRSTQLADYQNLFHRVNLSLGYTDQAKLPTNQRLEAVKTRGLDADPRPRRALFPIRPLPPHFQQPPRRSARQFARPLE